MESEVSILVMLDIGLKARTISEAKMRNESFNPCYVGYRSERKEELTIRTVYRVCFNPCYVGYRSESPDTDEGFCDGKEFQSLLCWI